MTDQTVVQKIKDCGYRVFQLAPGSLSWDRREPTWCYYTDLECKKIGYAQWGERESVSSVHKPHVDVGTGYRIADEITRNSLAKAINTICPNWDRRNASFVKKYSDWDSFCSSQSRNLNWRYEEV